METTNPVREEEIRDSEPGEPLTSRLSESECYQTSDGVWHVVPLPIDLRGMTRRVLGKFNEKGEYINVGESEYETETKTVTEIVNGEELRWIELVPKRTG